MCSLFRLGIGDVADLKITFFEKLNFDLLTQNRQNRAVDEIKNIYEDKKLINFFKKKRINNSEDIISIIFTSLYRKQNFKNINLETQIIKFYNIRNSLTKCEIWQNQNLIKNSNLNLNDSVKIRLKIYNKNCNRAVDCSNMDFNWKKIGERDLLIMGIISKKYYYKSVPNINYMRIKILKFSKKNVMIFGNFYKVGEQIEIVLNYDIIEKIHGSSPLLEVFPNNG